MYILVAQLSVQCLNSPCSKCKYCALHTPYTNFLSVPGTPLHLHTYTRYTICAETAASLSDSAYGIELNGHPRSLQQAVSETSTVPDFAGDYTSLHIYRSILAYTMHAIIIHVC